MPSPEGFRGYEEGEGIHFRDFIDKDVKHHQLSGPEAAAKIQQMAADVQHEKILRKEKETGVIPIDSVNENGDLEKAA